MDPNNGPNDGFGLLWHSIEQPSQERELAAMTEAVNELNVYQAQFLNQPKDRPGFVPTHPPYSHPGVLLAYQDVAARPPCLPPASKRPWHTARDLKEATSNIGKDLGTAIGTAWTYALSSDTARETQLEAERRVKQRTQETRNKLAATIRGVVDKACETMPPKPARNVADLTKWGDVAGDLFTSLVGKKIEPLSIAPGSGGSRSRE